MLRHWSRIVAAPSQRSILSETSGSYHQQRGCLLETQPPPRIASLDLPALPSPSKLVAERALWIPLYR